MRFAALFAFTVLFAAPVTATCVGQNLITALPSDQRAALQAAADAVPFAKGNLWQATKDGQTITLVGTYHLDDPRHASTITRLSGPMAAAKTLLVEAGPEEEAALKAHIARHPERLINATGPTLPEALTKADWLRLAKAMRARGVPPVFAAKMQPWYISSVLAIPPCQFADTTTGLGLDRRLIAMAADRNVPVASLEPYDTIFGIFDSFSAKDQLTMLVQTLDAGAVGDDMAITISDSYFSGENRLFWEFARLQLMSLSGASEAEADRQTLLIEEALINRRNRAWLPVISVAAAEGPLVVAFGALHLSGEQGVLNLLAMEGWTVLPLAP